MKVVLIRFRGGQRRELPLTGERLVVGRRPDCDVRIPTLDVSRQHCELRVTDDSVKVKDLNSSNGTFVNGKRVTEAELNPGDRLQIGPVSFTVQIDGKPEDVQQLEPPPTIDSNMIEFIEPQTPSETKISSKPVMPTAPKPAKKGSAAKPAPKPAAKKAATPPSPGKPAAAGSKPPVEEDVFELTAADFDLEDAISALEQEDDDEDDLP
ncbi:MAG: FHA domain-containing protein [Phycisphaerae bacterium]|nr:FHA domain-containing protein [Phycisphaerae bacterium]